MPKTIATMFPQPHVRKGHMEHGGANLPYRNGYVLN